MDYGKLSLEELKNGYVYGKKKEEYICNYCEQSFKIGQVFPINGNFYTAEHAIINHIKNVHGGNVSQLIYSETRYNTLTQNQRELLELFNSGLSDKEMAKKLNVSESTIRRQRFTFREKAKRAKLYLAIYEQIFGNKSSVDDTIIPIHNNAIYVDDRYLITEQERQHILATFFISLTPLVLKNFSPKEKNKVVILSEIARQFKRGKQYNEKEVNNILKSIYEDYISLRRYLIMYGFMQRTADGSKYWITE